MFVHACMQHGLISSVSQYCRSWSLLPDSHCRWSWSLFADSHCRSWSLLTDVHRMSLALLADTDGRSWSLWLCQRHSRTSFTPFICWLKTTTTATPTTTTKPTKNSSNNWTTTSSKLCHQDSVWKRFPGLQTLVKYSKSEHRYTLDPSRLQCSALGWTENRLSLSAFSHPAQHPQACIMYSSCRGSKWEACQGGAGTWPPLPSHDAWLSCVQLASSEWSTCQLMRPSGGCLVQLQDFRYLWEHRALP